MSMVIKDNSETFRLLGNYNKSSDAMHKSMLKISSGMKIGSSGDDPANWAITERMRERIRAIDQADRNVQNDTSMIKVADDALSNTIEIIQKLKERAVNSADDHNNEHDRMVIQSEVEVLLNQIDTNSYAASFNGQKLLDGSWAEDGLNFHVGGDANFAIRLKLDKVTSETLGLDKLDLSTWEGSQEALGVKDADGNYVSSITDSDGNKIFGILDTAMRRAIDQQTTIGAMEERLGYARENIINMEENMEDAESRITNADMAKEMTNYVKWNIQLQASQYILAQQNQIAASALDLLAPVQSAG